MRDDERANRVCWRSKNVRRYERWPEWSVLCVSELILYWINRLTLSQWRDLRTGDTLWSLRVSVTARKAALRTSWSRFVWNEETLWRKWVTILNFEMIERRSNDESRRRINSIAKITNLIEARFRDRKKCVWKGWDYCRSWQPSSGERITQLGKWNVGLLTFLSCSGRAMLRNSVLQNFLQWKNERFCKLDCNHTRG